MSIQNVAEFTDALSEQCARRCQFSLHYARSLQAACVNFTTATNGAPGPSDRVIDGSSDRVIDGPSGRVIDGPSDRVIDGPSGRVIDGPSDRVIDGPSGRVIDGSS